MFSSTWVNGVIFLPESKAMGRALHIQGCSQTALRRSYCAECVSLSSQDSKEVEIFQKAFQFTLVSKFWKNIVKYN